MKPAEHRLLNNALHTLQILEAVEYAPLPVVSVPPMKGLPFNPRLPNSSLCPWWHSVL